MKLAFIAALLLCSCATQSHVPSLQPIKEAVGKATESNEKARVHVVAAQTHVTKAKETTTAIQSKVQELEKQVSNDKIALDLAHRIQSDTDALTKELDDTQAALTDTTLELVNTKNSLGTAQTEIQTKQTELNKLQKTINDAVLTSKKYHKLKWGIVMPLAGALMGLLIWKFKAVLLPLGAIGIGIMVGVPILVLSFLAFKL